MRIKGNKPANKEDVVVAYGAGQFGSTMNGKRAATVKKLRKHLRRRRVSNDSSLLQTQRGAEREEGLGEEEDEGGGARSPAEADLIHIHGQRNANGDKGQSLYPVLFCNRCHTVWNRGVNAAQNIAWIFWWMRGHSERRPPGSVDDAGSG
ncbi:hypothetical protein V1524DRAFT_419167 [Lipomyces starkeyi]